MSSSSKRESCSTIFCIIRERSRKRDVLGSRLLIRILVMPSG